MLISQPDTGEQALEICDMLVRSGAIDAIVIDSVAALVPKAEIEGEIGDSSVGLQARLMSQALRKLAGSLSKSNTTCIFINQLREKIGVMFGNPETTTGGRALKFFSSVRIDIRRIDSIKNGNEIIGNRVRAKVVKNKVAAPFKTAEFDIMYGTGISKEGSILDMAVESGIVNKSGAWYTYDKDRLGQGREAAKEFLRTHPELSSEIEHKVRVACGLEVLGRARGGCRRRGRGHLIVDGALGHGAWRSATPTNPRERLPNTGARSPRRRSASSSKRGFPRVLRALARGARLREGGACAPRSL